MRKFLNKRAGKTVRSCITALLAVVMAVPVASMSYLAIPAVSDAVEPVVVEAADVELPEPIMSLDFERGFKGESEKNGLEVKQSKERLMFEEYKDDAGNYVKDENGEYIFKWTETPVIMGSEDAPYYHKGIFGNQPTTYDDAEKGNVFMLDDSMEAEWIIKTESDKADSVVPVYTGGFDENGEPLDKEAAEASTLQIAHTAHSAVKINNPFAGLDFSEEYEKSEEGPVWTKGVTISYWVKVPTVEPEEGQEVDDEEILNDSVLFTFENIQRDETADANQYALDPNGEKVTYEVNGYSRYLAIQESIATYGDDWYKEDPLFALGTRETVTDVNTGQTYTIAKDYGPLVRLNPEYEGTSTNKIYFRDDAKTKPTTATIKLVENGKMVDVPLVEIGANIYSSYCTLDTNEGSLIARGYINGSMQIAASNTFHFKEDDYYQKVTLDENGNDVTTPIQGAYDINPNNTEAIGKFRQFRYYNIFYFQGDATVTDAPDEWHYVTCVIQNDWVQFYVDGEEIESDSLKYHGEDFNSLNGKKYFNKGFGIRYPFHIGWTNVAEWIKDGTITSGPTNCVPQTMLEWISDPDTVLYLGYEGICAESVEQDMGTLEGTLLDDITFYDVPLTSEQAVALYEQAVEAKDSDKNKPLEPVKVLDFESDAVGSIPAGMSEIASNNAEKVDAPYVINEEVFGHVLKLNESSSRYTGALQFENPYKGRDDITGATISYWVKSTTNKKGKVDEGLAISFVDEPKILVHGKIQAAVENELTRTYLYSMLSCDAEFQAGMDTEVYASLKNKFKQSSKKNGNTKQGEAGFDQEAYDLEQEWNARLNSLTEWHYVTMVVENSGITMYMDGVKHENNQEDDMGPTFYGPRFYDGYYNSTLDSFAHINFGTGNQMATSLMEFLTQDDTMGYFGFVNKLGSDTTYVTTSISAFDDVAFYDKALSDEEVKTIYEAAKTASASKAPVAGEEVVSLSDSSTSTPTPTDGVIPSNDPNDDKKESGFTENADGTRSATANGVTVTGDKTSIPDNAKLIVNILGATSSKADYDAAAEALKAKGIDTNSYAVKLYDIYLEVDGKKVAPTGTVTVSLVPTQGYDASKASIFRLSDVTVMKTTASGTAMVFTTDSLGQFALTQKQSTISGSNPSASGSSQAGKTGDGFSIVVPAVLLAAAFVVIVILRRKEELMED